MLSTTAQAAFLLWMSLEAGQADAGRVHGDACEVLLNPGAYQGKGVRVRGTLEYSREGNSIAFPNCRTGMKTSGYEWSRSICYGTPASDPAATSLLAASDDLLQAIFAPWVGGTVRVEIELSGTIVAREQYKATQLGDGQFSLNGFCFLGQYPAVIRPTRIHSIEIRTRE